MLRVILLAATINRPAPYVAQIYDAAPVARELAVALVECEALFDPEALHLNWDEAHLVVLSTDWGLWQLNSRYHPQYRDNLEAHVRHGAYNFAKVLHENRYDFRATIAAYNTGNPRSPRGLAWADVVLELYHRLKIFDGIWSHV